MYSTLYDLERLFAKDFVDVRDVLRASALEPITIDAFDRSNDSYASEAAIDVIISHLEEREAQATKESREEIDRRLEVAAREARDLYGPHKGRLVESLNDGMSAKL